MKPSAKHSRSSGEPAEATARKIAILIELIRVRRLSLAKIQRAYGISDRQALRDLQELRLIGAELGFTITKRNQQGNVELADFKSLPGSIVADERTARSLIAEIFKAFGEPLHRLTEGIDDASDADSSFVRVIMPHLIEGSAASTLLQQFQSAWQDHARVRFSYSGKEREVEPAAVLVRSGRYYLLGRQVSPAGWRLFSLDEIVGAVKRCGTYAPVPPPAEYLSNDSIGFIKAGKKQRVAVTVSKRFAQTAASRRWQDAQTVAYNADGTATITFYVSDVDEVIRWALGYGDEAWIASPPAAVTRARALLEAMSARYARENPGRQAS